MTTNCTMSENKLSTAVSEGDVPKLKKLLGELKDKKNDIFGLAKNTFVQALGLAAREGKADCVKVMVEADPEWLDKETGLGTSAIVQAGSAGHCDVMEVFIESGSLADTVDTMTGYTALTAAAREGRVDAVRFLLRHGAKVNHVDAQGISVLMHAVDSGHIEVVKFLLEEGEADRLQLTPRLETALMFVPEGGVEIARLLQEKGCGINHRDNSSKYTALNKILTESKEGMKIESLESFLQHGADVNLADVKGQTPLMAAIKKHGDDVIKRLMAAGADVNAKDMFDNTPLLSAMYSKRPGVIKMLLDAGADVNAITRDDYTVLMLAVTSAECDDHVLEVLLQNGSNVHHRNRRGDSVLMLACTHPAAKKSTVQKLLNSGADPNCKNRSGYTPLLRAVYQKKEAICEALIQTEGIKISIELHAAVVLRLHNVVDMMIQSGCMPLVGFLHFPEEEMGARFLAMSLPGDINFTPLTPISAAFLSKDVKMIQKLLDLNFFSFVDKDLSSSVFDFLVSSGNQECLNLARNSFQQPWSLYRLSFFAISVEMGFKSDRREKVWRTELPTVLKKRLMFESS